MSDESLKGKREITSANRRIFPRDTRLKIIERSFRNKLQH